MRLALLSNVTVEVLAGMLREEHAVWLPAGFGAWMETALSVPDGLRRFNPEVVVLLLDSAYAGYDSQSVDVAVRALESQLPHATVIVPDLEDLSAEAEGTDVGSAFYDDRMWKLAAMPWSRSGLCAIGDEIRRLLRAMMGERKKVLALDLDDTLWEGTIGEDGIAGIRPRTEFQREIRNLRERGVLLVALSKNNPADVEPVWSDPRMVLRRQDFVDLRIDWRDKPANLCAAAQMLKLGLDAFVFLDDNPAERLQMRAQHPEVAVPEWPISVRRLARRYFPKFRITEEDRMRTEQYHAEAGRREMAATLSVADYLECLELRTEIHAIAADEIPRVAQLSQKSNQFNVRTHRHTVEDIARFAADPTHLIVTLHARDKFGDQGLVAFVHVAAVEDDLGHSQSPSPTWQILDWVMSCRAMNRRFEFTVQRWLEAELRHRGVTKLLAVWHRTAKNQPVEDLFEQFGFTLTDRTDAEKRYVRDLV